MTKCEPARRMSEDEQRAYQARYYADKLAESADVTAQPAKCPHYGSVEWWHDIQVMHNDPVVMEAVTERVKKVLRIPRKHRRHVVYPVTFPVEVECLAG